MRLDYWGPALLLTAAILFHATFPRYDIVIRENAVFRVDRWTGQLEAAGTVAAAPWARVLH